MINNQNHPLQSRLWGAFRKKTGVKVINIDDLLITIHPIPHTNYTIGYLPKGSDITKDMLSKLWELGKKEKCIFIQIEPNVEKIINHKYNFKNLVVSSRPLLTKYTFVLDLTKTEEELLKNMHPKTRYNIRLAEKKGVKIIEDNSDDAFEEYLRLTKETTQRQKFYAHSENYHRLMWETLHSKTIEQNTTNSELTEHLFKAIYQDNVLVTWILFVLGDTLYYPYGASSSKFREVMASNLMMWEAIKFGKKMGLKKFDMWGALGLNPNDKDSFYGFHKFKEGYGARHVEFVGSYDFIIDKKLYLVYNFLNSMRWFLLKFK
jgi:lipid II:glycine glycyltransferase (peptidoglycan interpeptide bridge formation enzyme)